MKLPVITRPANSPTGKVQFIDQLNYLHAAPRKKAKRAMTEAGFDAVMAIIIALVVGGSFAWQIACGLPAVLRAHGIL